MCVPTINIQDYAIYSGSLNEAADAIAQASAGRRKRCRIIACLNPHSYVIARSNRQFRQALTSADWLLPDGSGVVFAARWLGLSLKQRVTGPDIFAAVMHRLNASGGSVFFLGSTNDVLSKIVDRLANEFPNVVVAGTLSPPYKEKFSESENKAMLSAINSVRPDVLWVGMTAPKQEVWLSEHHSALDVGVAGAIGAAFDFFAGTVKRSPIVFRNAGLEWLPRLVQEPRRLWRRMFVSAPIFIYDIICVGIRKRMN